MGTRNLEISNNQDAWDMAIALERLGGDEVLLKEMLQIFAEESPKFLKALRDGIGSSEACAVERAAHTIKGELAFLNATAAAGTAQELEDMGHSKDLAGAEETLLRLEREILKLKYALAKSLESRP